MIKQYHEWNLSETISELRGYIEKDVSVQKSHMVTKLTYVPINSGYEI